MKKFLFFFFLAVLTAGNAFAEGIRFVHDKKWKEVLAMAKAQKKLIFLDAYASWCGPCKYMQRDVFTGVSVGSYFNRQFINVKMDMEEGEGAQLSEQLGVTAYPTLFFMNGDGEVVHKYVGALDVDEFMSLGKDALDPSKQFYTVKKLARQGKLAPKAMHTWLHQAEKLEDDDRDSITTRYLSAGTYPLMEKEMLLIVLDHAEKLTAAQLDLLRANSARVREITGKTQEEFGESLLKKVRNLALEQAWKEEALDFEGFRQVVARYFPGQAALEQQKIKVRYYFIKEQEEKGLDELLVCLENASLGLPVADMASMIVDHAGAVVAHKQTEKFARAIERFSLLPGDVPTRYYRELALLVLYKKAEDEAQVKRLSAQILANESVPARMKAAVEKLAE